VTDVAQDALISARENERMFDRIAGRYDLLNALMSLGLHRHWRRAAVRTVLAGDGRMFLDIGCGTGDMALALLRRSPQAHLTGVDLSSEMLGYAVAKTRAAGLQSRADYRVGDATALPFSGGSFDGIVCAFCLRNIVDRAAALREMCRVLRPGGRLVVLELTRPAGSVPGLVHRFYTRRVIPLLGRALSQGSAYQYLADSIEHFPAPAEVVGTISRAGFAMAEHRPLTGGFVTLFSATAPPVRGGGGL
jgi:demethylmenaquinone methyltransferase/2-methoxy-6-polyprenyl-1,4-benzoquinol methylase